MERDSNKPSFEGKKELVSQLEKTPKTDFNSENKENAAVKSDHLATNHQAPSQQPKTDGEEEEEEEKYGEVEGERDWETEWDEDTETEKRDKSESSSTSETLSNIYAKLSPFNIEWSFGVRRNVELINLTSGNTFEVFYVSSHFGVIYNYQTNKMTFLPGHNNCITSISSDASGRWLVSADGGEDSVIIIWDNQRRLPVWCLYNVFPCEGTKIVRISQDARFLAAINMNFNFKLKFWLWTYGRHPPDGVVDFDPTCGRGKHIDFNHLNTEQFAVTMEYKTIFCEWNNKSKKLKTFTPDVWYTKKLGIFRESVFLDDNHTALTSTSLGQVLVWSDVRYSETITEQIPATIEKNLLKVVRIHKAGITSLRLCDKAVVTSSEDGIILYHDQSLRLLYMTPTRTRFDPLVSISFNLLPTCESDMDPFSPEFVDFEEKVQSVYEYESATTSLPESSKSKFDFEREKILSKFDSSMFSLTQMVMTSRSSMHFAKQNPSDYTIESRPFLVRDFIFLTTTGKIGYVSHRRKKFKNYLYHAESDITVIDCNPNKAHLVVGNTVGQLAFYEYTKKRLLTTKTMLNEPITALKYSNLGQILLVGFQSGTLLEVDPIILETKTKMENAKAAIKKITFSQTDGLFAFYDQASVVYLMAKKRSNCQWSFMGKYKSHYKPIVDILFEYDRQLKYPRLFTIGEDRMLVEYDTNRLEENKLKLSSIVRIEQTAIPLCFDWHPKFYDSREFLISNNEYKLKVVDMVSRTCQKTTLGPTADTPINFIKVIPSHCENVKTGKMIYTTNRHIGLRILPSTGNPFEGMGMVGHPEKIVALAISYDYKNIFTAGEKDGCVLMWSINLDSVDVACPLGGIGLEPFLPLIEHGPNGFLFKEIEDFFYYAQIIHQGEDPNKNKTVTKSLALCEIPDLFRSLGYFPTDYEINNLLHELKHSNFKETGELMTEITFEDCVKVFLNHRPVVGMSLDHINKVLMAIADLTDPTDIIIERNELYKALEERAEAMDHAEMIGYLCILLLPKDETNPVPASLSLKDFAGQVLGIDLTISEDAVRKITHAFDSKNGD